MSRRMRICLGVKFMAGRWVLGSGRHDRGAVEFGEALADRGLERAELLALFGDEADEGGIGATELPWLEEVGIAPEERPEPRQQPRPWPSRLAARSPLGRPYRVTAYRSRDRGPRPAGAGDRREGDEPATVRHEGDLEVAARSEADQRDRRFGSGGDRRAGVRERFGESHHDGVLSVWPGPLSKGLRTGFLMIGDHLIGFRSGVAPESVREMLPQTETDRRGYGGLFPS